MSCRFDPGSGYGKHHLISRLSGVLILSSFSFYLVLQIVPNSSPSNMLFFPTIRRPARLSTIPQAPFLWFTLSCAPLCMHTALRSFAADASIFDSDSYPLHLRGVNRAFSAVTNVQLLIHSPVLLHGGNGECQRLVIGKSRDVDANRRFQRGGRVLAVEDFPGGRFDADVHTCP